MSCCHGVAQRRPATRGPPSHFSRPPGVGVSSPHHPLWPLLQNQSTNAAFVIDRPTFHRRLCRFAWWRPLERVHLVRPSAPPSARPSAPSHVHDLASLVKISLAATFPTPQREKGVRRECGCSFSFSPVRPLPRFHSSKSSPHATPAMALPIKRVRRRLIQSDPDPLPIPKQLQHHHHHEDDGN